MAKVVQGRLDREPQICEIQCLMHYNKQKTIFLAKLPTPDLVKSENAVRLRISSARIRTVR